MGVGLHNNKNVEEYLMHFCVVLGSRQENTSYVSESQLREVIKGIGGDQMSRFVVECIDIPEPTYTQIWSENGIVYETLMQCIIIWRNKIECQGQDAAEKLQLVQQDILGKYSAPLPIEPIPETQNQPNANSKKIV